MEHFYAYIDESGDEGFGKLRQTHERGGQSTWLILGAVIVRAKNDKKIVPWRDAIKARFTDKKKPDLHWGNLNHDQKVIAAQDIARLPLGAALAMSHKVTIPGTRHAETFKRPQQLYNYLVRFLLERLVSACKEAAGGGPASLHLTFSRRGGTNYQSMSEYLKLLASGQDLIKAPRSTDWRVLNIDGIKVENHSKRAGLQMADMVTSAFGNALEPNRYGNYETRYAELLFPKLIKSGGTTKNSGLTIVPSDRFARCDQEQLAFLQRCWGQD